MEKCEHAIVLLPAGIRQNNEGKWVTTDLSEEDSAYGAPGGKLRVYAAKELLNLHQDAVLITGGGLGYDVKHNVTPNRPTLAEILLAELRDIGVDDSRIILDHNSNSTYQELIETERLAHEHGIKTLTYVTSRYALPRLETMVVVKFSQLKNHVKLFFIAAEDVLLAADFGRWSRIINEAYQSKYLNELIKKEENGIKQIKNGTYIYK